MAKDVSILCEWLKQDILNLAAPNWAERAELWDFIVAQFKQQESECLHRIRSVRTALGRVGKLEI